MTWHGYFDWNEESVNFLKTLYKQGVSYTKIARSLGCTRPSAIAKAQRLGLTCRTSPILHNGRKRQRAGVEDAGSIRKKLGQSRKQASVPTHRDDLSDLPGFENFGMDWEQRWRFGGWSVSGVSDWQPKTCQYIFGGNAISGNPGDRRPMCDGDVVSGRAYCVRHLALCTYTPEELT